MIDNYPNPEQIFFIRELFSKADSSLTDEERDLAKKLRKLLRGMERQCSYLNALIDESVSPELTAQLREELNPFARPGVIFMGSGHFSEYGCNRLHEYLHDALSIVSGFQQDGLMGTERGSQEELSEWRQNLRGIISGIAEKLGEPVIFKENPQNEEPIS